MEWGTSKRHMNAEHRLARAVQTLQADVHSSPASSQINWPPADWNGLVRFAERQNLVSARVPSHFKQSLLTSVLLTGYLQNLTVPKNALFYCCVFHS